MVGDVAAAADWYVEKLGFSLLPNASPAFAAVERGPLRLLLSGAASSAGRPMPDGSQPEPGGWNRFQLVVEDLAAEVERLRGLGVSFLNDIVKGPGGQQIVTRDPSGNVVELFQPGAWG
jgi:catechol 2,3-dioxygenase-like lactoylglutathione lyase family enzyme